MRLRTGMIIERKEIAMHFIYIMRDKDRDAMLNMGFELIKANEASSLWVFANKDTLDFALEDTLERAGIPYILSDIMTF